MQHTLKQTCLRVKILFNFIDRKEARKLDRFCQFAVVVADQAFSDSGLDIEKINSDRAGVIWGSGIGGMDTFYTECVAYGTGNGTPRFNPFLYLNYF